MTDSTPGQRLVLVVDDEPCMVEVYMETLQRVPGLEVVGRTSSRDALRELSLGNFDLMLTNLWMPRMTGMQLLAHVQENYPTLPVLVVTGDPTRETAERCRRLGARAYLLKPFNPDELQARVTAILSASLTG
jgi:DNA-binding NtrC family response regulator